ncbi:Helitron like N domain-containing protein, partial [Aphis craccivora]
ISNPITRKIRTLQYEQLLQYLKDFKDSDSSSDPSLEDILQKLSIKDVNEYKSIIRTLSDGQQYLIEYIGKSQRGISKLMRDIVENLKSSTDLSVKEQLKKIASTFSGSQEISAQEAVHPDKRTRMLKPMTVRGEMDPKFDDIFFDGLNEYYSCRPHSLEDVILAEFGSNYEVRGKKKPANSNRKTKQKKLDDNEIQIEGEQGRNNNQLVDDEDWIPDDVLINDVGDY